MSSSNPERVTATASLLPTRYDRVASLLISLLILTGSSVAVLVVLWLGTGPEMARIVCRLPLPPDGASGETSATEPTELDLPQISELPQLAITDPIVEISTLLSSESIAAATMIDIGGLSDDKDGRPIGPPLPPDAVPRWERWEIRYNASSIDRYAKQLDFFKIELGAVGGGEKLVDYASHVSAATPKTRAAAGSLDSRLYLTWRGGTLEAMDRKLLQKAGIEVEGRIVLQFYPQEIEDLLAQLESEHAKDGRVDKLSKTIFGVRRSDEGYEFFVIEQR